MLVSSFEFLEYGGGGVFSINLLTKQTDTQNLTIPLQTCEIIKFVVKICETCLTLFIHLFIFHFLLIKHNFYHFCIFFTATRVLFKTNKLNLYFYTCAHTTSLTCCCCCCLPDPVHLTYAIKLRKIEKREEEDENKEERMKEREKEKETN